MDFLHEDNQKKGVFYIKDNDKEIGDMTYIWNGDNTIIIDHTGVNPSYQGKGIGYQLLEKAIAFAREKQIKIIPLCPFAKAGFNKHPEYADVLK